MRLGWGVALGVRLESSGGIGRKNSAGGSIPNPRPGVEQPDTLSPRITIPRQGRDRE